MKGSPNTTNKNQAPLDRDKGTSVFLKGRANKFQIAKQTRCLKLYFFLSETIETLKKKKKPM